MVEAAPKHGISRDIAARGVWYIPYGISWSKMVAEIDDMGSGRRCDRLVERVIVATYCLAKTIKRAYKVG